MSVVITNITSTNTYYPYTFCVQDHMLHIFKKKHIFYADKPFTFQSRTSKKGKTTNVQVKDERNGQYSVKMTGCTGIYHFMEVVRLNEYEIKSLKIYTKEQGSDRWQNFINNHNRKEGEYCLFCGPVVTITLTHLCTELSIIS